MRTPGIYRLCDNLTEAALYFMVVFYPWAFGTTERWAIWIMNGAGYWLGALLVLKWLVRWRTGYQPPRWACESESETRSSSRSLEKSPPRKDRNVVWLGRLTFGMAGLTVVILGYCLVSALNARMVSYQQEGQSYVGYRDCVRWLPHSYDQTATWFAFWSYLGLALSFGGARDFFLGKSPSERHRERDPDSDDSDRAVPLLPERLQRMLWVLCLNGAALGVVSILQRLDGTSRLLWVMARQDGYPPDFAFGPYAYRSSAAQFFNLLWPVCLGFWSVRRAQHVARHRTNLRAGSGPHLLLLPAAVIMAACPIISTSRGGALLTLLGLPLVFIPMLFTGRRRRGHHLLVGTLLVGCLLGLGIYLGWKPLAQRLQGLRNIKTDLSSTDRMGQYASTLKMIQEHRLFGAGPYAYKTVYQYQVSPGQNVYSFAHSDWLQTIAEWGWAGFILIVTLMAMALLFPFLTRAGPSVLLRTSLASICLLLLHATFDFPLQIQSILFTFLLILAMLVSLPPRHEHS